MPVPKKQQGKPLGGIGAQAMTRGHSLVLDDRLISKQYIKGRIDDHIDDTVYSTGWDGITDKAPSVNAVYDKINSLGVVSDIWGQDDSSSPSTDVRFKRTGDFGIGNGTGLAFSEITHKLTLDGDLRVGAIDGSNNDIYLDDGAILYKYASGGSTAMLTLDSSNGNKSAQKFAIGSTNPSVPLEVSLSGSDVTAADGTGVIQVGADSAANMGLDANEIQARSGGSGATIYVNSAGGDVEFGNSSSTITANGNMVVDGNLTVSGTATSINTTNVTLNDNIFILNNDATGTPSEDAGIEVERGDSANTRIVWDESTDKWSIQPTIAASTYYPIINTGDSGTVTNTMLAGSIVNAKLSNSAVTVGSTAISLGASSTTIAGLTSISCLGTAGDGSNASTGTTALTIRGGDSVSTNAAVSITGHLEATTKSFNIPHPLDETKRLVYGCLEGPEYGMYARGTTHIGDYTDNEYKKRMVGIELPDYWFKMVGRDYTISLTAHGNYNVWIVKRNDDGFHVKTNTNNAIRFDWTVIGRRQDAKLEVEPNAR